MARDYARKRSPRRRHARRKQQSNIRMWLAFGTFVLLVMALAAMFLLSQEHQGSSSKKTTLSAQAKQKTKQTTKHTDHKNGQLSADDDYWFYDLLEKKRIEVDVPPASHQSTVSNQRWVMQCGSFLKREKADSLRAQIALAGLEANIMPTKEKDGRRWYRVVLGPYQSKRKAESDRHRLQEADVIGCRIW